MFQTSGPRPHVQHDVAEYLAYSRSFLISDPHHGGWQCRLHETAPGTGVSEVRDQAETWPLFIPMPPSQLVSDDSDRLTIQQRLLSHWYSQADDGDADLNVAPTLLRLPINRYTLDSDGPAKNETCIYPDLRISIRRFCHGVDGRPPCTGRANIPLPLSPSCSSHPPGPKPYDRALHSFPLLTALGHPASFL